MRRQLMNSRVVCAALLVLTLAGAAIGLSANAHNTEVEATRRSALDAAGLDTLEADARRGAQVARAGGCIACHTDSEAGATPLAGGAPIETPFGRFVAPNISSDPVAGVGKWTRRELAEALVNGRRPDGGHYWPALPYAAYAVMKAQDIADLHAWLMASEPATEPAAGHDLLVPDLARSVLGIWKARYVPDVAPGDVDRRGRYLVEGPGHCAACHAQRDLAGGVLDRSLSGNTRGPDGENVPDITRSALADWSEEDIAFFLEIGMLPDGDFTGSHMTAVIEHGTAHLYPVDREAISVYLKSDANK